MKIIFVLSAFLLLASCQNVLPYNETLAVQFWRLSGMALCNNETLYNWSCGYACNLYKDQISLVNYTINNTWEGGLSYTIFYDHYNKYIISVFRGTVGTEQLVAEILQGGPVPYDLYPINGSMVMDYFYNGYVNYLRTTYLSDFTRAVQNYPDSTYVFTGHSLGGAMTTHACLDTILGGIVPREKTFLYNFGSPRVGNFAWATYFVNTVPTIYRIVHYRDTVPHVPPCWLNTSGICQIGNNEEETQTIGSEYLWHAWHIWPNLWYNENSTSYVNCVGGEDPHCADQFALVDTNPHDHTDYFQIHVGCEQSSSPFDDLMEYVIQESNFLSK